MNEATFNFEVEVLREDLDQIWVQSISRQKSYLARIKNGSSNARLRPLIGYVAVFVVAFICVRFMPDHTWFSWPSFFIGGLLGVVTFLALFLILFKRDMKLLQQSDWGDYLLGSRHMSFAKDGMRHKDQHSSSHTDWKLVKDMVETPSHIFFFLSSTSTVIFVPKRIFTNEQDQDHFIAATKAWMRAAQASDA